MSETCQKLAFTHPVVVLKRAEEQLEEKIGSCEPTLSPPKTQHRLIFRGLRSPDAVPWTHWRLTATPRPPSEFGNDLWSLHVVSTV